MMNKIGPLLFLNSENDKETSFNTTQNIIETEVTKLMRKIQKYTQNILQTLRPTNLNAFILNDNFLKAKMIWT